MAKAADRYFICDPWRIIEEGFNPDYALVSESIFALSNEAIGVRGYFEEGTDAPSLQGSYLAGVYERENVSLAGAYKGVVTKTHFMVNGPDWLHCRIHVSGETLSLGQSRISGFTRVLDMRTGLLTRRFDWMTAQGITVSLIFERLLSMDRPQQACQRITLTADADCDAEFTLGVRGDTVHQMIGRTVWETTGAKADSGIATLDSKTRVTGQRVRTSLSFEASMPGGPSADQPMEHELFTGAAYAGMRISARLLSGTPIILEKKACIRTSVDQPDSIDSPPDFTGFEAMLETNRAYYDAFWKRSDVEICGDDENQQGIRFCLFQLHQTFRGLYGHHNIGAKGLTGEAYNGHAFWDTETYCLPYYLLTDPIAAKSLLMFRYHTLPEARARAKDLDCAGACYPIATLSGEEACTLWQHASLQMQPSTAVAHGIWHYARLTGDTAFERGEGLEMLVDICRYIISRGSWNADRSGFGFYGVMGPDEFHMMVHNNYYTNLMGQRTLQYTLRVLGEAGSDAVPTEERDEWQRCADAMILDRREDGVIPQHEGFFGLPHLDIHSIPQTDFPLYANWSYDRIYRTDMIKQPDVLMAMFLYPEDYDNDTLRANFDYYEPRCIHESSLSPSVHGVLASRLGRHAQAQAFFSFATRLDLDNYNRNTGEGLHLTSIAAAWVTIVYGFGGLRTDGAMPSLQPVLPEGWTRYSFMLTLAGSLLRVTVDAAGPRVARLSGDPVRLVLAGIETEV